MLDDVDFEDFLLEVFLDEDFLLDDVAFELTLLTVELDLALLDDELETAAEISTKEKIIKAAIITDIFFILFLRFLI